jgi:hypothetical protein
MNDHAAYLDHFAHALVSPAGEPSLFEGAPRRVRAGLDIYRNNVFHSLVQALGEIYPVVKALVGKDFFNAMALEYARAELPSNPVLAGYGAGFPAFLEAHAQVRDLPYLADVARLERAWLDAFHSADAPSLGPGAFARLTPEQSTALKLQLHPATRTMASLFPVLTIWEAHQGGGAMPEIDLGMGVEEMVITRPQDAVTVWRVPSGTCELLARLSVGTTLGAAYEAVRNCLSDFDLGIALALLFQAGAFMTVLEDGENDD